MGFFLHFPFGEHAIFVVFEFVKTNCIVSKFEPSHVKTTCSQAEFCSIKDVSIFYSCRSCS